MTEPRRYWAIESPDGEFADIAESEELCWHYATQSGHYTRERFLNLGFRCVEVTVARIERV